MTAFAQDMPSDYQEVLKSLDRKVTSKQRSQGEYSAQRLEDDDSGLLHANTFGFGGWVALTKAAMVRM